MAGTLHIVFGTGPLGKNTARALIGMGKQVRMVNRSGKLAGMPAEVEVVAADAYNPTAVIQITRHAETIYQCAQPEYHDWAGKFPALQASIMQGAAANGAKFIVGDNLYLYGDGGGQTITEESPIKPISKKGIIRRDMAAAVMAAHGRGEVRAAIGRASTFFGGEYDVIAEMVYKAALLGKRVQFFGKGNVPHTFTYIPDYGRLLAALGTREEALGEAWIAPSNPALTQEAFLTLISAEVGKPLKASYANRLMMSVFGLFNPGARETVEMMYEFEKPYIISSAKAERTFGLKPTPFPQAIRETFDWARAQFMTPTERMAAGG
ncbi:MAG TPA: NAD-dependent epimerase/dehydratase family protein [Aggregatilineales bacterium]|nr:NAD-dependent epimerase/dehydratase family protein [Anaerolineales bacterium]HRE46549.1 NAD-dependent epimerase/dehydratase family protein [Aggregatilineales bacterium]